MYLFYRICRFTWWVIFKVYLSAKFLNNERLPATGAYILCMNHQSFIDPPLAGTSTPRVLWYLARKTLWDDKVLGWFLSRWNVVPVDQERPDMTSLKKMLKLLKEDKPVLLFPEGERTRDGQLLPGKPGVGLLVAKSGKPVIPMRIFGAFEALPINGKLKRHPVTIKYGHPIDFTEMIKAGKDDKDIYQKISDRIMEEIGKLKPERD